MEQIQITRQSGQRGALVAIKLTREEYRAVRELVERHPGEISVLGEPPDLVPILPSTFSLGEAGIACSVYTGTFPLDLLAALISLVSVGDVVTLLTASLSLAAAVCDLVGALHKKKGKRQATRVEFTRGGESYKIVGDSAEEVAKLLKKLPLEEEKPKTPLF